MCAMVNGFGAILASLCVLSVATSARADLWAGRLGHVPSPGSAIAADKAPGSSTWDLVHGETGSSTLSSTAAGACSLRDVLSARTGPPRQPAVDADAGPSSMSLLLSAFGSLGAWQLIRSSRKFHLGCVPDWFHAGAPGRIGQTTVVDLDDAGLLTFTIDRQDGIPLPARLAVALPPEHSAFQRQHSLTIAATRGPPPPAC